MISKVCKILRIKKTCTTPYHLQGDGLVECLNRTLVDMISAVLKEQPSDWDKQVRRVCLAYNTSVHKSMGYSPFFLLFGHEARLPLDIMYGTAHSDTSNSYGGYAAGMKKGLEEAYKCVRERLTTEHNRQKYFYNQKCHGDPYSPGDMVRLHSSVVPCGKAKKFHHPWTGPWKVLDRICDTMYRIQDSRTPHKKSVVHFDRLRPCKEGMCLGPREKISNVKIRAALMGIRTVVILIHGFKL